MSIAEMKIEAINQITRLTEEDSLKEISEHLSKLNKQKALIYQGITLILKADMRTFCKNWLNDFIEGCVDVA